MFALAAAPRISRRTSFACRAGHPFSRARGHHPRPHRNPPHLLSILPGAMALHSHSLGGNLRPSLRTNPRGGNRRSSRRRSRAGANHRPQRRMRRSRVGDSSRPLPPRGANRLPPGGSRPGNRRDSQVSNRRLSGGPHRPSPRAASHPAVPATCASRRLPGSRTWVSPPRPRRRTTTRRPTLTPTLTLHRRMLPTRRHTLTRIRRRRRRKCRQKRTATHLAIRNTWTRMRRAHSLASS